MNSGRTRSALVTCTASRQGVIAATGPMATHLGDDQILKQAVLSGTWTMGPGIRLVGGVFAYDLQTDTPGVTGYNNQGIGATTGMKLAF